MPHPLPGITVTLDSQVDQSRRKIRELPHIMTGERNVVFANRCCPLKIAINHMADNEETWEMGLDVSQQEMDHWFLFSLAEYLFSISLVMGEKA